MHNKYKIISIIYYAIFKSSDSCTLTSQFQPAAFQVLTSHTWLHNREKNVILLVPRFMFMEIETPVYSVTWCRIMSPAYPASTDCGNRNEFHPNIFWAKIILKQKGNLYLSKD